jgi:peptidyl-prolyl cis-trans isomerase C
LLQDFFAKNKEWFDESLVRASHILVQVSPDADAKAREAAKAKLLGLKKQIEDQAAKELAKLDPKADNLAREQARLKALTDAFAEAAKGSDCPSKAKGGDLGYFPRVGAMVEPFAAAAFALQPGQLSGVVETQFGYHLILLTQRQPGKDVKYDDLKDEVREVYAAKLRADLLPKLRKEAKIEITPK